MCVCVRACVCDVICGGTEHLNGNEHLGWWTNHMIAFIIASRRGDIYAMTGSVMSYQSAHTYTWAHMLWLTVMRPAVGHVWHKLHISVRVEKTWSPPVKQCSLLFHLLRRRPSIPRLKKWTSSPNTLTPLKEEKKHLQRFITWHMKIKDSLWKSYPFVN